MFNNVLILAAKAALLAGKDAIEVEKVDEDLFHVTLGDCPQPQLTIVLINEIAMILSIFP